MNFKKQFLSVFLVSLLPLITLFFRGVVWGADSFAFMSVACGNAQHFNSLGHSFFAQFVGLFNCNFYLIIIVMWFFYFLCLIGLWLFARNIFVGDWFEPWNNKSFLLPVLVGTFTPLFFVEALRFENDFFGWTLSFIALGLFSLYLTKQNNTFKALLLILFITTSIISINFWFPSIIIVSIVLLLPDKYYKLRLFTWFSIIITYSILNYGFFLSSFTLGPIISEELPLIGLVFILHLIHFWKEIPKKYLPPTIMLTILGLIKLKYLFLATPFLILGILTKENDKGLYLKNKKIPIMFLVIILGIGWVITGINLSPTQTEIQEIKELIKLSNDNNISLYNDFGYGWLITYLGKETNYKVSFPNPDYNNLAKPYYAYTNKKIDCTKINTKTYFCES